MNKVLAGLTLAGAMLVNGVAAAAPVDFGNGFVDFGWYTEVTYSDGSVLHWIDVTETVGRSFNDVSNQLATDNAAVGQDTTGGWRYASGTEVSLMVGTWVGDGLALDFRDSSSGPYAMHELVPLLGYTYSDSSNWETLGLTSDTLSVFHELAVIAHYGTAFDDYYNENNRLREPTESEPFFGSFLVRDASSVPSPATLPLLLSGLAGLAWVRRRK